ncbi:uncharacterized protein LOC123564822 [Mercenaria mercenaria]|uniref:uncharacterized protein LOC123564822 n=1 Tax=Mercenaria mercenaria TaxID=6596 RepID=UPI00234EADFE|nr:uncharacterized protein LOC123564822 [Mercenaria mercenaria]XP_053393412.1 uncharacterized protein LOC123564822 [Mercenaria mercenaria]
MAGKDIKIYRKKLLKFLVALRDVGIETKFHIYDILLDPLKTRNRKSQFIAVAIVSKDEIVNESFSALKDFTDNLHNIEDPSVIVSKVVHHDRVAVAMNAGEKYFFEHGECRIFDPYRHCLFKIIDEEISSNTEKKKRKKIAIIDKGGRGVLENMENTYIKTFNNLDDAVLLLFSFYIPCSIDFHDCARLLHDYVKASDHEMAIGYEHVHNLTDKSVSLKWLNMRNVTLFCNSEVEREINYQVSPLIREQDENCSLECDNMYAGDEDTFDDFIDDIDDLRASKHWRQFEKGLCRKILKEYKNFY